MKAVQLIDTGARAKEGQMFVLDLPSTDLYALLDGRSRFFEGTQHDHQSFDWDGNSRQAHGTYFSTRWIDGSKGFVPSNAVVTCEGYGPRRPDASMPIGAQIVADFTDALLGRDNRPHIQVKTDEKTEQTLIEILREAKAWAALTQARDIAGSCGAAMISCAVIDGVPVMRAHHPKNVVVLKWKNRLRWEPEHAIEQKVVYKTEINPETRKVEQVEYWQTREWTATEVIYYQDVPVRGWKKDDPIPLARNEDGSDAKVKHPIGRPALVWVQNTYDTETPYGVPDYEGAYHLMDKVDRAQSQVVKAAIANVDPTPVLQTDMMGRRQLNIGNGELSRIGANEKLYFMEMSGESIRIGWESIVQLRRQIERITGAELPDQDEVGKQQSGEAIEKRSKRFKNRVDRKRVPVELACQMVAELWISLARALGVGRRDDPKTKGIMLPPLVEEEPAPLKIELDGDGNPVEQEKPKPKIGAYEIGSGSVVTVAWAKNKSDAAAVQVMAGALGTATGGSQILSAKTATLVMAESLGLDDPAAELRRIEEEKAVSVAKAQTGQFPPGPDTPPFDNDGEEDDEGGEDDEDDEGGAKPAAKKDDEDEGD